MDDCSSRVDHIIVAGDLVGYYYWPQQVVRLLMEDSRVTCIRGNHEDLLEETRESSFADKYRRKYGSGYDVCWDTLNDEELDWLGKLPSSVELKIESTSFGVYHGSPLSTNQYVYPDAPQHELIGYHTGHDFTVLGHTHYPLVHHHERTTLLNPGSVGQPRDLGGQASYALIDLKSREVSLRRVLFDTEQIIATARSKDPEIGYLQQVMLRGLI